jgi:hypothetical protein
MHTSQHPEQNVISNHNVQQAQRKSVSMKSIAKQAA